MRSRAPSEPWLDSTLCVTLPLVLLTRRHIAVVHFADLPTLDQAMERTGDRPLGDPGGLAHLGRPEPLRPRGRDGRQDLPLATGRLGRRHGGGDPWDLRGDRRRSLGLSLWSYCRRARW
jgi:hypothetical protein